jgi:trimethylamine--corrinoid protein Co-methyltransferase
MKGIPCAHHIKVLSEKQLDRIHAASLRLLERTGIRVDSEDARARLVRAGASAHASRKSVVCFHPSLVEDAIRKVPRRIVYPARDPQWDIEYDGEHAFPYAGGGDPKMIDLDTGKVRPSTYVDIEMAVRLGDALENCRFAANIVEPTDVPAEMTSVKTVEAALRNSVKPAWTSSRGWALVSPAEMRSSGRGLSSRSAVLLAALSRTPST